MPDMVIQRCVFPTERRLQALYFRMDRPQQSRLNDPEPVSRRSIWIARGCKLITDMYFNSFFESYWRHYTRIGRLQLRVRVTGRGTILLLRRSLASGLDVLAEVDFDCNDEVIKLDIPEPHVNYRESGAMHFDIVAKSTHVKLIQAEWVARDVEPEPMRMVAGYCTFNREKFLLDNVRSLLDDPEVAESLSQIVVVDQGTNKVKDHPIYKFLGASAAKKLKIIEQDNFGGAGGFTRSIIEARNDDATHMLLMDDDAITEPESVFRAVAFQALAKQEVGVGGQMLDMLRPLEVYESGALVDPASLGVKTPIHRLFAGATESLNHFLEVAHIHYNAWWFFAFPLRLVDKVGLPLPMFIRGDDVEFGYRLHQAGVPTTTVPGFGIWHEPFYLKRGGWQAYYDLRNMMLLTSLHYPVNRKHHVGTYLKRFMWQMMSHNYCEAALLCEAAMDFARGPAIIDEDPREIHKKLLKIKKDHTEEPVARSRCLPFAHPEGPPVTKKAVRKRMIRSLKRLWFEPTPVGKAQPDHVIPDDYARWWHIGMTDVVAAEDWHTAEHRVYRRNRETFRALLKRGLRAAVTLYRNHTRVVGEWRAARERFTSDAFWNHYLGIDRADEAAADVETADDQEAVRQTA